MSDIAIRVNGLGKEFRIGSLMQKTDSFRDVITGTVTAPFRRARALLSGQAYGAAGLNESVWALKDINFDIKQGEVVGIIGHNGAGKSTLLKVLSRITEPSEGYAEIYGRIGALLEVGTGFHLELTGRENVFLNGSILGMSRHEVEARFDEIVDFAGVEKFIDTPVKHYSSGMRLRLGFAVAAHLEPEILVIDEVLAVGDAAFQQKCLGKMQDVAQAGRTVLIVSHNMQVISSLTERCIMLQNGRIIHDNFTPTVVNHYLDHFSNEAVMDGMMDLQNSSHRRADLHSVQNVKFTSISTHTTMPDGTITRQSNFMEGEPITIRIGVEVKEPVQNLQIGCSVRDIRADMALFTVPSDVLPQILQPGEYAFDLRLDPNYLREGLYNVVLRAFVDGSRRDHVGPVYQLAIHPNPELADQTRMQRWVTGPFYFDYTWSEPNPVESPLVFER